MKLNLLERFVTFYAIWLIGEEFACRKNLSSSSSSSSFVSKCGLSLVPRLIFSFTTGREKNTAWYSLQVSLCICAIEWYTANLSLLRTLEICTKNVYVHSSRIKHHGSHHRSRVNSTNTRAAHHKGKVTFIKSGNHHREPGQPSQRQRSYPRITGATTGPEQSP